MSLNKRVLVVDDEEDTLTYFTSLLEDNGFDTDTALDGEEALAKIKSNKYDLITLDMSMPEKSGVRVYRELKGSDEWQHIPVLIITGISDDFKRFISARSQVPPPEGYLSKPIEKDEFLELARKLTA